MCKLYGIICTLPNKAFSKNRSVKNKAGKLIIKKSGKSSGLNQKFVEKLKADPTQTTDTW
jgi:hypothetical protein